MGRIAELAERANEQCHARVGRDVINLLGHVDDMPSVYRGHRIFVGVSRAAIEAAACGCTVVLCGNEGRGGVLSLERLLCDVDNLCSRGEPMPDAAWLESELRSLLSDERKASACAEFNRAWVQNYRSAREVARLTREVYIRICDEEESRREEV